MSPYDELCQVERELEAQLAAQWEEMEAAVKARDCLKTSRISQEIWAVRDAQNILNYRFQTMLGHPRSYP